MTISTIPSQTMNATQLLSYFVRETRDNGTSFYRLTDDCPDCVTDLVRECHGDELPNDWRYETIVNILYDLKNDNNPDGDCGVDTYTSDLIDWLSVRRLAYIDELQSDGMIRENATMDERIKVAQWHVTEEMVRLIEEFIEDCEDEDCDS